MQQRADQSADEVQTEKMFASEFKFKPRAEEKQREHVEEEMAEPSGVMDEHIRQERPRTIEELQRHKRKKLREHRTHER